MQKYDLEDIVYYEGKKFKVVKVHYYFNAYEHGYVYSYDIEYCDKEHYPLNGLTYILQRKLTLASKFLSTVSMQTSLLV